MHVLQGPGIEYVMSEMLVDVCVSVSSCMSCYGQPPQQLKSIMTKFAMAEGRHLLLH